MLIVQPRLAVRHPPQASLRSLGRPACTTITRRSRQASAQAVRRAGAGYVMVGGGLRVPVPRFLRPGREPSGWDGLVLCLGFLLVYTEVIYLLHVL
ncbi:hypothetical protein WJX74_004624 [Apatococcus lobatus]|uniref:Uncharacterized protein n=1 Tax=Apatococcus lobatus TaxID=904363 RepID=A0AAW1S616_9CHLO